MSCKILLIELPIDAWNRYGRHYLPNPGTLAVGTFLKKNGYDVKIVDTFAQGIGWNKLIDIIKEYAPDIVGSSSYTVDMYGRALLSRIVKSINPAITTVLGGIHASLVPEETLRLAKEVDFLVLGEGELTFLELIKKLESGKSKSGMRDVDGLAFMEGENFIKTNRRNFIENLDKIPLPDYSMLPMVKYRNMYFPVPPHESFCFYTSRGCQNKCNFCSETVLWGHCWRGRSAELVVEEFSILNKNYGKKAFLLNDDDFLFNRQRNIEFIERMSKSGLDIEFRAGARVDTLLRDKDLLVSFRKVGLTALQVGVESFYQNTLDSMNKNYRSDRLKEAVECIKSAGILYPCYFLVTGNENDNWKTMSSIIKKSKEYNFGVMHLSTLTPWPGTPLFEEMKTRGRIKDFDYRKYNLKNAVMSTKYLSTKQVALIRALLFYRWFFSPVVFIRNFFSNRYLRYAHLRTIFSLHLIRIYYLFMNLTKLWKVLWYNRMIDSIHREHLQLLSNKDGR